MTDFLPRFAAAMALGACLLAAAPPASSRRRSRHRRDEGVMRASAADNRRTGRSAPNRPQRGPSTPARRATGRASALHAMRARPRQCLRSL
ncbi:hypothetical protein D5047_19540 [Verminephrobacter eiseniae]|nr:hypothetical protein [Verminephrobacter eiseniae]